MPTTLTGVVLFVVLLLPGVAYVAIRERNFPDQKKSPFRESATVATVSVAANVFTILVVTVLAACFPGKVPDVGRLILDGSVYFRANLPMVLWWSLGAMMFAIVSSSTVAFIVAHRSPHPSAMSSWWILFDELKGENDDILVNCILDDGSRVEGSVLSFSTAADETQDRDLVLTSPISYAYEKEQESQIYDGADAVCIPASRIVAMYVAYVAPFGGESESEDSTALQEASASSGDLPTESA
ncbi:DUF6338 family protein [Amycolatopsis sp. TRM77291]